MLNFVRQPLEWYVERLKAGEPFTFAGYSDAEWYCMLGLRAGKTTGLGQVLDPAHGKLLDRVLRRRHADPRWLTAVPECLPKLPSFCDGAVDRFLARRRIAELTVYERDMVLDDRAARGGMFPLVAQAREMSCVVVGPEPLYESLWHVLEYRGYVVTSTPNLHREAGGIERVVAAIRDCWDGRCKLVLVSAGVSAAVILDALHDEAMDRGVSLLDVGSVWDAFAGLGGQRLWRADLYAHPEKLAAWKHSMTTGAPYPYEPAVPEQPGN